MKKIIAGALLAAVALPMGAQANELIVGVKGGVSKLDVSGFDPVLTVSAQLSYEFLDLAAVDIAVELEASATATDGKVSEPTTKSDFSTTTVGAYISARTAGPIYAIGRIGVAKTDIDFENDVAYADSDDSGVSLGGGVGFSLGVRTELELTRYEVEDDEAYYLSLGAAF